MNRTEYTAFGWRIDKYEFSVGEKYVVDVAETTPRDKLTNQTFYVKGSITAVSSDPSFAVPSPRGPGFFNDNLPEVMKASSNTFTVEEDAEWWCVNWQLNGRKLPLLEKVVIAAGQELEVPAGTKLFLCRGEAAVNGKFFGPASEMGFATPTIIGAITDVYGLKFLS